MLLLQSIRYFRNPCERDPQQEISKTLNSSKIPLKYLAFTFRERALTFGERAFTFGERALTFGERAFAFGDNRDFWNFFLLLGGFGTPWVGGPEGFSKISNGRMHLMELWESRE